MKDCQPCTRADTERLYRLFLSEAACQPRTRADTERFYRLSLSEAASYQ